LRQAFGRGMCKIDVRDTPTLCHRGVRTPVVEGKKWVMCACRVQKGVWSEAVWEPSKSCPNDLSSLTLVFDVNDRCCWSGSDWFWKSLTWASKWGWFQLLGKTAKKMVGAVRGLRKRSGGNTEGRKVAGG
jgi:hypothetical protein